MSGALSGSRDTWLRVRSEHGDLAVVASAAGLRGVVLPGPATLGQRVHARFPGAHRGSTPLLEQMANELRLYFAGGRSGFDVPLDLTGATPFEQVIWETTRTIPYGETRTYAWVAGAAGDPRALRAAGGALGRNPIPIVVPCHRVVAADGTLGGFSSGLGLKRILLRLEGSGPLGQTELPLAGDDAPRSTSRV